MYVLMRMTVRTNSFCAHKTGESREINTASRKLRWPEFLALARTLNLFTGLEQTAFLHSADVFRCLVMPLSDFDIAGGSVFSHTSAVFVFFSCLLRDRSTLALILVLMPLSDVDVARGSVFSGTLPVLVVFFNCPLRGRSTLALALVQGVDTGSGKGGGGGRRQQRRGKRRRRWQRVWAQVPAPGCSGLGVGSWRKRPRQVMCPKRHCHVEHRRQIVASAQGLAPGCYGLKVGSWRRQRQLMCVKRHCHLQYQSLIVASQDI